MTKEKDTPQKSSRRSFVQTVATALVAAPLVASGPQLSIEATEAEAAINPPRVTHGPPIIIDDGSIKIEMPQNISNDDSAGGADRPFRLHLATALREIYSLTVYGNGRNGVVDIFTEEGMEPGASLSLWTQLQDNTAAGNYSAFTTQPNLKIIGKAAAGALPPLIETDKKVKDKYRRTNKKYRPFKYEHPGYPGNDHFRIGKWELRRNDGTVEGSEVGSGSLYESFRFFIVFSHA